MDNGVRVEPGEVITTVTAICFSPGAEYLCAGIGSMLWTYDLRTGKRLAVRKVFKNESIHGIRFISVPHRSQNTENRVLPDVTVVIWGIQRLVFIPGKATSSTRDVLPDFHATRRPAPILLASQIQTVCRVVPLDTGKQEAIGDLILDTFMVGLAHNQVALLQPDGKTTQGNKDTRKSFELRTIECEDRSLTYCIEILSTPRRTLVASGTVFREILLWTPLESTQGQVTTAAPCLKPLSFILPGYRLTTILGFPYAPLQVLARLTGHQGSIFDLSFSISQFSPKRRMDPPNPNPGKISLVSASDDRTLRYWEVLTPQHARGLGKEGEGEEKGEKGWGYRRGEAVYAHGSR
eukprot:706648-Amorphochlora_amoeboformis.AAC.1